MKYIANSCYNNVMRNALNFLPKVDYFMFVKKIKEEKITSEDP